MNTVFSDNLKRFRQEKKLTQEQVAEALNVGTHTVSRWECGTTLPDVLMLPRLARLYCVTVDDFYKESSTAYENYAQRLVSVFEATHDPEDFIRADIEFK
ncbi:MAG: helix-turn-helix transcriptional regulator, partial [Clostridia bacterium]|nr:helix-turn-helix transcriptional regulator [Clostridia bacterium]